MLLLKAFPTVMYAMLKESSEKKESSSKNSHKMLKSPTRRALYSRKESDKDRRGTTSHDHFRRRTQPYSRIFQRLSLNVSITEGS